jgi:ABC-type polysaccharide/polyol phosphate export permease
MISRFIKDMKKYSNYIYYCVKSELKTEVANSYLNWVWWILEPFCFMLIYAFVFGVLFNAKEEHFSVFIFIGITLWNFFANTTKNAVRLIKNNKGVISKVYIPKHVLILIRMGVNGFKMLIGFGIIAIMMIFYHIKPTILIFYAIPILLLLFVITFAFSTMLMHFGVYVDDLANIWTIVLRMVMYITGIFFNIETRAKKLAPILLKANPMAVVLSSMRKVLLYGETPHYKVMALWFIIFLGLSLLGIRIIYKNENNYIKSV